MTIRVICVLILLTLTTAPEPLKLGIEQVSSAFRKNLKKPNGSYALITNQTGKDQHGQRSVDILKRAGFTICYLLAPEHGIQGAIAASKEVPHARDAKTNITILSLYGN